MLKPLLLSLTLTAMTSSCRTTAPAAEVAGAKNTTVYPPLKAKSFPSPLSQDDLRKVDAALSDDAFAAKWQAALKKGTMMGMRAFAPAYHADMAAVARADIPGADGLCVGDGHPGNFGFLLFDGKTVFGYNDLDDSGYCPVAVDALRYFAILSLYVNDRQLVNDLIDLYAAVTKDPSKAEAIDADQLPDWANFKAKHLAKEVDGGHLLVADKTAAAPPDDIAAITQAYAATPAIASDRILDALAVNRAHGGSGGFGRYTLLVEHPNHERTIVELKEMEVPGTDLSAATQHLTPETRLPVLKQAFWQTATPTNYLYLKVGTRTFLLRDRMAYNSLDLSKLGKKAFVRALHAEVGFLANLHSAAWKGVKKQDMGDWLSAASLTVVDRWTALIPAAAAPSEPS